MLPSAIAGRPVADRATGKRLVEAGTVLVDTEQADMLLAARQPAQARHTAEDRLLAAVDRADTVADRRPAAVGRVDSPAGTSAAAAAVAFAVSPKMPACVQCSRRYALRQAAAI